MFIKGKQIEIPEPPRVTAPRPHTFVVFQGANSTLMDSGELEFSPRAPIAVNVTQIVAVYDNTIVAGGHKIRVMESMAEINRKLIEAGV